MFAGGESATGEISNTIEIYDACQHTITEGTMPAPRLGVTLIPNAYPAYLAGIWLFAGTGSDGLATSSLYKLETPAANTFGAAVDYGDQTGFERTGQVELGGFITGEPPTVLDANNNTVGQPLDCQIAANHVRCSELLPTVGAEADEEFLAGVAFLGGSNVELLMGVSALPLATTVALPEPRDRAAITVGGREDFVVVGGAQTSAVLIDPMYNPSSGVPQKPTSVTEQANVLDTPRFGPSIAATYRFIMVAGGVDAAGTPIPSAEILDAYTLAHVATVPIAARTHAVVLALPTDQFAIVGGDDPSDLIELFTPALPPLF